MEPFRNAQTATLELPKMSSPPKISSDWADGSGAAGSGAAITTGVGAGSAAAGLTSLVAA